MPVWHETIKKLAPANLVVLGVVQEQHAERTRLYKQWKQYDFPIAQDSVTKLGAAVVPIFIGIDEYGIVRNTKLRPDGLEDFLAQSFAAPDEPAPKLEANINFEMLAADDASLEHLSQWGDQEMLFRTSGAESYDRAISAYHSALEIDPIMARSCSVWEPLTDSATMSIRTMMPILIWRRSIGQRHWHRIRDNTFGDDALNSTARVPKSLTLSTTGLELQSKKLPREATIQ